MDENKKAWVNEFGAWQSRCSETINNRFEILEKFNNNRFENMEELNTEQWGAINIQIGYVEAKMNVLEHRIKEMEERIEKLGG